MPNEKQTQVIVAEQVFEARFVPTASFLDVRGNIADHVSTAIGLAHWAVSENTINFRDKPDKAEATGAFLSFRNAGFFAYDPPTRNFFEDKAESFWKSILGLKQFNVPRITRLGVRTKAFLMLDPSFAEIEHKLRAKLLASAIESVVGVPILDSMVVVDFEESEYKVRMQMGPMHKGEVGKALQFDSPHFASAGLFIDCDVYSEKVSEPPQIGKVIRSASKLSWAKADRFFDQIGL